MKKISNHTCFSFVFFPFLLTFYSCKHEPILSRMYLHETKERRVSEETMKEVPKEYYKETVENLDYRFFHKTISEIALPEKIASKINPADRIVICSADKTANDHENLQYIIENWLKTCCLNQNMILLERGYGPLKRIYSEKNHDLSSITPQGDFNSALASFKPLFNSIKPLFDTSIFSKFNFKPLVSSIDHAYPLGPKNNNDILFADKLITYRILEAGIKKAQIIDTDKIIRLAGIIIEINLVESETSRILASQIIENFKSDEISRDINASVEEFRLENVKYPFPLLSGFPQINLLRLEGAKTNETFTDVVAPELVIEIVAGNFGSVCEIVSVSNRNSVCYFAIPNYTHLDSKSYIIRWDLKDKNGNEVPKGKYMVNIKPHIESKTIYSQQAVDID